MSTREYNHQRSESVSVMHDWLTRQRLTRLGLLYNKHGQLIFVPPKPNDIVSYLALAKLSFVVRLQKLNHSQPGINITELYSN